MREFPRVSPTRRQFLQTAGVASIAGVVLARTSTAAASNAITNFAIELNGSTGGWLSSLELPASTLRGADKPPASFGFGAFKASYTISEACDLLTWILALPRKTVATPAGRLRLTDQAMTVRRRIDWTGGHVTSIKFPKLAAAGDKRALVADIEWEADTVTFPDALTVKDKPKPLPALPGAKPLIISQFRVAGFPGAESIGEIELPTITAIKPGTPYGQGKIPAPQYGNAALGELKLRFAAAGAAASKQAQKVIKDGVLTADEYFDLTIDMLDASLTTTRATISLRGCGLRSYAEDRYEPGKDPPGMTLGFAVDSFDLVFKP